MFLHDASCLIPPTAEMDKQFVQAVSHLHRQQQTFEYSGRAEPAEGFRSAVRALQFYRGHPSGVVGAQQVDAARPVAQHLKKSTAW